MAVIIIQEGKFPRRKGDQAAYETKNHRTDHFLLNHYLLFFQPMFDCLFLAVLSFIFSIKFLMFMNIDII